MGYHVFDPETDTLVVDGARTNLDKGGSHLEMNLDLPPEPGRYRVFVSPMQENVAWYYEHGWRFLLIDAVVSGGRGHRRESAHRHAANHHARAHPARRRPRLHAAAARDLAQSRPDPDHGAARHSEPLSRIVRRRILDRADAAAADAHLLLRVRRGAEDEVRKRSEPLRIRALLLRRNAALAGVQRSRGTGADGGLGASEFREEAGLPGRDAAGESGGFRTRHRMRHARSVSGRRVPRERLHPGQRRVAAAGDSRRRSCSRWASAGFWRRWACSCGTSASSSDFC